MANSEGSTNEDIGRPGPWTVILSRRAEMRVSDY
jgi:hypothetical protein